MKTIEKVATAVLPTTYGTFEIVGFIEKETNKEHVALVFGDILGGEEILSRVHSECLTGDVLHSLKCDCGFQLDSALKRIVENGSGVLIYHREEGRGIGLINKIKAYALQEQGYDTVESNNMLGFPADMRDFNICAQIYKLLGVKSIRLLTNNPKKVNVLKDSGINIVAIEGLYTGKNKYNQSYLETKKAKMEHMFSDKYLNEK